MGLHQIRQLSPPVSYIRQGSEYPAVIIPVLTQHYAMLQRNLLYTGVTRGKRLVVLVGQMKAVAIAVRNVSGRRRCSKLDEWLRFGAACDSLATSQFG
jgi:exodeoxyribonuclease V alpha subunit